MLLAFTQTILEKLRGGLPHVNLEGKEKDHLGRIINEHLVGSKDLAEATQIPYSTLMSYAKNISTGMGNKQGFGRDKKLDRLSLIEIQRSAVKRKYDQNCYTESEFKIKVIKEVGNSAQRIRVGGSATSLEMSERTLSNTMKELNGSKVKGQLTTQARKNATIDWRNAYAELVVLESFGKGINPALLINTDDTQYYCKYSHGQEKMVVIRLKHSELVSLGLEEFVGKQAPPTTRVSDNEIGGFFIKSRETQTYSGFNGPMTLIIASEEICPGANDLVVVPVSGLSHSATPGQVGFVAFCKTRSMNEAFFLFHLEEVIVEFVKKIRLTFPFIPVTESAMYITDSETDQCNYFVTDPKIEKLMSDNLINGMKIAAGTTSICTL